MSKANAQAFPPTETEAASGAAGASAAVVPAAQAAKAADAHRGVGGLYTVVNGERKRVHATKSNHEKAKQ